MRPRRKGHALIWMSVTRAQCECGLDFRLRLAQIVGKEDEELQDMLMDEQAEHIKSLS